MGSGGIGRALLQVGLLLVVLLAVNRLVGGWVSTQLAGIIPQDENAMLHGMLALAMLYAVLLALPFVPGVEVGLAMLAILGAKAALAVYLATVGGLTLAFLVGRMIPVRVLLRATSALGLVRVTELVAGAAEGDGAGKPRLLAGSAPAGIAPFLVRNRYLALALVLNLPGNTVIGGGGGIAMIAGTSRMFSTPGFILTVALAVSPVPIVFYFLGAAPG